MSKTTASPLIIQSPDNLTETHPHIFSLAKQLSLQYVHQNMVAEESLQKIGQQLWEILDIEKRFQEARQRAGLQILPLIIVGNPALTWECLYHPEEGFLGKNSKYTLSRQYRPARFWKPGRSFLPKGPLKVLLSPFVRIKPPTFRWQL